MFMRERHCYTYQKKRERGIVVDSKFGSSWGGWCSIDPFVHMGWVYGKIVGGGRRFLVILDLS
jgi:hypothetical protein